MTINMTGPSISEGVQSLYANSSVLSVSKNKPGFRKKVSTQRIEIDADKDLISVSANLLESSTLEEIRKLDGSIDQYLNPTRPGACTLECQILKNGMYTHPNSTLPRTVERLKEFAAERDLLARRFCYEEYWTEIAKMVDKLRSNYSPDNYPSPDQVYAKFGIYWQVFEINAPTSLQSVDARLFDEEQKKQSIRISDLRDEFQTSMRNIMAELVGHMADSLADPKKKYYDTTTTKLLDFVTGFSDRNLVSDVELASLVEKAKGILSGVTTDDLRKNPTIRKDVSLSMAEIKASLDMMIEATPIRMISFDDAY